VSPDAVRNLQFRSARAIVWAVGHAEFVGVGAALHHPLALVAHGHAQTIVRGVCLASRSSPMTPTYCPTPPLLAHPQTKTVPAGLLRPGLSSNVCFIVSIQSGSIITTLTLAKMLATSHARARGKQPQLPRNKLLAPRYKVRSRQPTTTLTPS
jgi:hypothetical protein